MGWGEARPSLSQQIVDKAELDRRALAHALATEAYIADPTRENLDRLKIAVNGFRIALEKVDHPMCAVSSRSFSWGST